jgi:hypothetical protein
LGVESFVSSKTNRQSHSRHNLLEAISMHFHLFRQYAAASQGLDYQIELLVPQLLCFRFSNQQVGHQTSLKVDLVGTAS